MFFGIEGESAGLDVTNLARTALSAGRRFKSRPMSSATRFAIAVPHNPTVTRGWRAALDP